MSAISAGLKLINVALADCQFACNSNNEVSMSLRSIEEIVKNMEVMNIFMIESINRVLDCSKSQNGMKLVSKNETLSIFETLSLPFNCLREMKAQADIKIELSSIDTAICSHIITDKQWLQENMLCLLSNAVKYSSQGIVQVSISRVNFNDLPSNEWKGESDKDNSSNYCPNQSNENEGLFGLLKKWLTSLLEHFTICSSYHRDSTNEDTVLKDIITFNGTPTTSAKCLHKGVDKSESRKRQDLMVVSAKSNFMLLVEVQDSGIGISQEVMDELFSPFKQAQRLAGGTGLGLYSLAKRVEALEGLYGVRARDDGKQGSVFWFSIPYKPDQIAAKQNKLTLISKPLNVVITPNNSSSTLANNKSQDNITYPEITVSENLAVKQVRGSKTSAHGLNILLIDDSLPILMMIGKMLRIAGHTVTTAGNGSEALNILIDVNNNNKLLHSFDVIIVDLNMPVMDGFEFTKRLRKYEESFNIKGYNSIRTSSRSQSGHNDQNDGDNPPPPPHQLVIVSSANSDNETSDLAFEAGCDAFLEKPLQIEAFHTIYLKLIS